MPGPPGHEQRDCEEPTRENPIDQRIQRARAGASADHRRDRDVASRKWLLALIQQPADGVHHQKGHKPAGGAEQPEPPVATVDQPAKGDANERARRGNHCVDVAVPQIGHGDLQQWHRDHSSRRHFDPVRLEKDRRQCPRERAADLHERVSHQRPPRGQRQVILPLEHIGRIRGKPPEAPTNHCRQRHKAELLHACEDCSRPRAGHTSCLNRGQRAQYGRMELWLLVGAVVLIALTVWIVWPAQRSEEVTAMTDTSSQPNLPPQGAAFEDQYTSATADLSAGGVATARETGRPVSMGAVMPESAVRSEPWASPTMAREGVAQAIMPTTPPHRSRSLTEPRTLGAGAASILAIGGGIGGAWLYQRWQRERSRPINRFRRGARSLLSHVPELDDVPDAAAPMGGTAAALLVSSVILARAMRRTPEPRDAAMDRVQEARERVQEARERARNLSPLQLPQPRQRQAVLGGIGIGGTALAIGGGLLVWRLLKGRDNGPRHLYITDRMGE